MVCGQDGRIRKFSARAETDDGVDIESYAFRGPVRLWNDTHNGQVLKIDGYPAEGSGDIDGEIYVANSHEGIPYATAQETWTWSLDGHEAGDTKQPSERPMATGGSMAIKLGNDGSRAWSMEKMTVDTIDDGEVLY